MRTENYSQVPVIDGHVRLCTAWSPGSSVAHDDATGATPALANAMVKDSLRSPTPTRTSSPCCRRSASTGISWCAATTASSAASSPRPTSPQRFETTAWPFFVVGEIEFRLRKCLGAKLGEDAIRASSRQIGRRQQTGNIADLMFGQYVKLLTEDPEQQAEALQRAAGADQNWQALGWAGSEPHPVRAPARPGARHPQQDRALRQRTARPPAAGRPAGVPGAAQADRLTVHRMTLIHARGRCTVKDGTGSRGTTGGDALRAAFEPVAWGYAVSRTVTVAGSKVRAMARARRRRCGAADHGCGLDGGRRKPPAHSFDEVLDCRAGDGSPCRVTSNWDNESPRRHPRSGHSHAVPAPVRPLDLGICPQGSHPHRERQPRTPTPPQLRGVGTPPTTAGLQTHEQRIQSV